MKVAVRVVDRVSIEWPIVRVQIEYTNVETDQCIYIGVLTVNIEELPAVINHDELDKIESTSADVNLMVAKTNAKLADMKLIDYTKALLVDGETVEIFRFDI